MILYSQISSLKNLLDTFHSFDKLFNQNNDWAELLVIFVVCIALSKSFTCSEVGEFACWFSQKSDTIWSKTAEFCLFTQLFWL